MIQDGHLIFGINTDGDLGVAQGIGRAVSLDLVDGLLELEREVFGQDARFLPSEDACEIFFGSEGAMGIHRASRFYRKALVEVGEELGQIEVTLDPVGDAT